MKEELIFDFLLKSICTERDEIKEKLKTLPRGFLRIIVDGEYTQWHAVLQGNSTAIGRNNGWRIIYKSKKSGCFSFEYYLPKKEREFARKLALREYYERRLVDITTIIDSIIMCMREAKLEYDLENIILTPELQRMAPRALSSIAKFRNTVISRRIATGNKDNRETNNYLWKNTEFTEEKRKLVSEIIVGKDAAIIDNWMKEEYQTNPKYPEKRTYKCVCGIYVRSRIEMTIANLLTFYGIPFRYEQRFVGRNGNYYYPDFYIIHPKTGKKYVWEHLGMLDCGRYIQGTMWKIEELLQLGFVPGDTLLFTGETDENNVNMHSILCTVMYILNDIGEVSDKQTRAV